MVSQVKDSDVKDRGLVAEGLRRIEWADRDMPVLERIRHRFSKEKPLQGVSIGACLHVTTETANLMRTLVEGGAVVRLCASNPLSTQDDVAAALAFEFGVPTFAIKGESKPVYYSHIGQVLDGVPAITMDDGADLVSILHTERRDMLSTVTGGTEETTTGVIRLRSMAKSGVLRYPIIAVNDAGTKHLFDNRYGTGQSTIDAIIRATNRLMAGRTLVIAGYGWCGKGTALRAAGAGANLIITEVDPIKALEASMDGYRVMPMDEAARIGEVFITVTGDINVIRKEHFLVMRDNAIVCNSGHFNVELDLTGLAEITTERRELRPLVTEHTLVNGHKVHVLAEGRLVNLSCAEGHPACVMDMSFANQALSVEYLVKHREENLPIAVFPVPSDIDYRIATLKLETLGIEIDTLTPEQQEYLASWSVGT